MSQGPFTIRKVLQVFGNETDPNSAAQTLIPAPLKTDAKSKSRRSWEPAEIPLFGESLGFMKKPDQPLAITVFVTKGGVLKTSLTLNLARMAALHNIRTCIVGLDMQGDISTALGFSADTEEGEDFKTALEKLNATRGLADCFAGEAELEDILVPTDLPTLFFIPETPELIALDQSLVNRNRREYWLKEKIVAPLKEKFDLIIMDCSPNWSRLITNALVACDVLVSPVECKINNYRNLKTFEALIAEFKEDMQTSFRHVYAPTRLTPSRRLSADIFEWYQTHLKSCTQTPVRESTQGEEATALHLSVPEHSPSSKAAVEMRAVLSEIWSYATGSPSAILANHMNAQKNEGAPHGLDA